MLDWRRMEPWPIQGIIVPIVTPLRAADLLDEPGLENLVEHLLEGGVNGLFVLGTTGEGPALPYHTRHELVRRVCDQVDGRVPVLVGIMDTAYSEAVELARFADDFGADAVVAAPPYYAPLSEADLVRFVERLSVDVRLPILLYNTPYSSSRFEL